MAHTKRRPDTAMSGPLGKVQADKLNPRDSLPQNDKQVSWREKYKVHPAADVFSMMSDEDLAKLGDDIKANGLKHPIIFQNTDNNGDEILLDGRNRLEAMERAGIRSEYIDKHYRMGDPVAHIIGLNIHRRHLTKQQQADLIVAVHKAAAEASRQVGEVPKQGHAEAEGGEPLRAWAYHHEAAAEV
jgi:ParB/Sulfiredoxin domain